MMNVTGMTSSAPSQSRSSPGVLAAIFLQLAPDPLALGVRDKSGLGWLLTHTAIHRERDGEQAGQPVSGQRPACHAGNGPKMLCSALLIP